MNGLFTRTPAEAIDLFLRQVAAGASMEVSAVRRLWDAVPPRHQLALAEELGKLAPSQSRAIACGHGTSETEGWSEKARQALAYFRRGL